MAYPERGAGYTRHPQFLQDAIKAEGKAQGGPVNDYSNPDDEPEQRTPYDLGPPIDHHGHDQPGYSEGSKGAVMQAMRERGDRSQENRGQGPRKDKAFSYPGSRAEGGDVTGQMMAPTREMRSQQENQAQDADELVRHNLEQMAEPSENQSRKFVNPYGQRGRLPNASLGMKRGGRA